MRELYKNSGARTGQKAIVTTVERTKFYWDEYQLKDYHCILLAKAVGIIYDLVKHGVLMKELNIGGIAQKDPEKDIFVTKSVYLNKEDALKLKDMHDNYGVENIYFQATPSFPMTSLEEVLEKFDLA